MDADSTGGAANLYIRVTDMKNAHNLHPFGILL